MRIVGSWLCSTIASIADTSKDIHLSHAYERLRGSLRNKLENWQMHTAVVAKCFRISIEKNILKLQKTEIAYLPDKAKISSRHSPKMNCQMMSKRQQPFMNTGSRTARSNFSRNSLEMRRVSGIRVAENLERRQSTHAFLGGLKKRMSRPCKPCMAID